MGNCIAPLFLSEIAPYNYRGAFGTLHQLFVTLGIFISSVLGISQIMGMELNGVVRYKTDIRDLIVL